MPLHLKHVPAGEGSQYTVIGGDQITIKATSDDTDGALTVIETVTPPKGGPPPHVHHRENETFYVLDGEFEFVVGGNTIRASTATFVMAPKDIPHRFQNVGDAAGKLLVICQPAGFEKFVEEFAQLPIDQPPDLQRMAAIGEKYGIEFV